MKLLLAIMSPWVFVSYVSAMEVYAFRNGCAFGDYEKEAKTLKSLGYTGISQVKKGGEDLAERIAIYERHGLKVLSIYLNVEDTPIKAEMVKPFAGKKALIELTVRKRTPQTIDAVTKTVEMASKMGIKVALYPHHGFAVATMPQAMAIIEEVQHTNLGVMFNLCHFLRGENVEHLETTLEKSGDRLFAISTNGADIDGKNWTQLIQPLDQGSFPQERLFKKLKALGFPGPVGIQCYGVKGDKQKNLQRSMEAWKKVIANY